MSSIHLQSCVSRRSRACLPPVPSPAGGSCTISAVSHSGWQRCPHRRCLLHRAKPSAPRRRPCWSGAVARSAQLCLAWVFNTACSGTRRHFSVQYPSAAYSSKTAAAAAAAAASATTPAPVAPPAPPVGRPPGAAVPPAGPAAFLHVVSRSSSTSSDAAACPSWFLIQDQRAAVALRMRSTAGGRGRDPNQSTN